MLVEPQAPATAKTLIRKILKEGGNVGCSQHAEEELAKDDLTLVDCVNVLRGGVVEAPDFERGTWRYRVRTNLMVVVVAFRSETHLRIVTAWRL